MENDDIDLIVEQEVIELLAQLCRDVHWEYGYHLVHALRELPRLDSEGPYCHYCVWVHHFINRHSDRRLPRRKRRYMTSVQSFTPVDRPMVDKPIRCRRCAVLIHHTPSVAMLLNLKGDLKRTTEIFPTQAAILFNALGRNGIYKGNKRRWWPVFGPELVRILLREEVTCPGC